MLHRSIFLKYLEPLDIELSNEWLHAIVTTRIEKLTTHFTWAAWSKYLCRTVKTSPNIGELSRDWWAVFILLYRQNPKNAVLAVFSAKKVLKKNRIFRTFFFVNSRVRIKVSFAGYYVQIRQKLLCKPLNLCLIHLYLVMFLQSYKDTSIRQLM